MSDHSESAATPQQTTPYPGVNTIVHDLLMNIHAILGPQLRGMYLVGSLALGDFHPKDSDLDLIIVTSDVLSDEAVEGLRDLHQRFDDSASAWARRFDVIYIPRDVLRDSSPAVA